MSRDWFQVVAKRITVRNTHGMIWVTIVIFQSLVQIIIKGVRRAQLPKVSHTPSMVKTIAAVNLASTATTVHPMQFQAVTTQ
jgi:hypothetical protein